MANFASGTEHGCSCACGWPERRRVQENTRGTVSCQEGNPKLPSWSEMSPQCLMAVWDVWPLIGLSLWASSWPLVPPPGSWSGSGSELETESGPGSGCGCGWGWGWGWQQTSRARQRTLISRPISARRRFSSDRVRRRLAVMLAGWWACADKWRSGFFPTRIWGSEKAGLTASLPSFGKSPIAFLVALLALALG